MLISSEQGEVQEHASAWWFLHTHTHTHSHLDKKRPRFQWRTRDVWGSKIIKRAGVQGGAPTQIQSWFIYSEERSRSVHWKDTEEDTSSCFVYHRALSLCFCKHGGTGSLPELSSLVSNVFSFVFDTSKCSFTLPWVTSADDFCALFQKHTPAGTNLYLWRQKHGGFSLFVHLMFSLLPSAPSLFLK